MELPVSGLRVRFRAPDGNDDLAILEAAGGAVERAMAILPRLARIERTNESGAPAAEDGALWRSLTVTDFEAALLGLRRFLFGDRIACVFRDETHGCETRMEIDFSITAFLDEARPSAARGVERDERAAGWFRLREGGDRSIRFRLPTIGDQAEVMGRPDAARLLARRCVEGDGAGARTVARVERAMETLAPAISRPLMGTCPECGKPVQISLYVARLVIDELESFAAGTHEEIDAIAAAYHWDEAAILAMPQQRRRAYVETIRRRERVTV